MDINELKKYEYIVFGFEHYNPLGIVRSLGEEGINPIGVIVKNKRRVTSASRYFKEIHMVDTVEEGYQLILKLFGENALNAGFINTFVLTSDDTMTSYLDQRYDEIHPEQPGRAVHAGRYGGGVLPLRGLFLQSL